MPSMLATGEKLVPGDILTSQSGRYRLVLQPDGNLVLYGSDGLVFWSSGTKGRAIREAIMQPDGNLVLLEGSVPIWSTRTSGYPGARLKVLDEGAAVVETENYQPWSTNTEDRLPTRTDGRR